MKTKAETSEGYVVAALYLAAGVGALVVRPKYQGVFHKMLKDKPLPTMTRFLIAPTPWGWLLISIGLALLVLANERWKWRVPSPVLIVAWGVGIGAGMIALFLPIVDQTNEVFGG